ARSATVALVTTRSGTAIASETIDAGWVARSIAGVSSAMALRTGGLHRERRLGLHPVERLAHEVGEHPAGAGLDVGGGASLAQRRHHVGPADRVGEGGHELLAHVLER